MITRKLRLESLEERALLAVVAGGIETAAKIVAPTEATTWVVNTLEDPTEWDAIDDILSLREAIGRAATGDTIIFNSELSGETITLNGLQLEINNGITINASDIGRITIDANGASRIFNVVGGSADCPVVLTNLALTGASSEGDGGAINNSGILTINNSLIKGNSAAYGAGIYNTGTLSISNSEISGNAASGLGGGINNHFATLTMTNCTISGNSSSVYGGGIVNHFSSLTISNSIITFNKASYDVDIYNIVNAKLGYNLDKGIFSTSNIIGFDPCFVVAPVFESGRIANLDELDLSLKSESWAIDRGSNAFVNAESDVTGNLRISGAWKTEAVVDIGAYEYQGRIEKEAETPSTVVTTAGDAIDDTDHLISLREAVLYSSAGDTITFAQSLEDQAITLLNKQIVIDKAVSIDASGVNSITVNANGLSSVFDIIAGTEENPVKLSNLVITGGSVQYVGGGINNSGNLYIVNSKIKGNHAGFGAGIYNEGTFRAVNVEICGNTASNYGGGVFNNYDATLVNATVTGNFSSRTGGGIYNQETMSVYNSIVVLNTANAGSPDIYHLEREVLNGYNTLSAFTEWTSAVGCLEYNSVLPLFVNWEECDYRLSSNSQAINAGNNAYVDIGIDLLGNSRIIDGVVDLGAYEFQRDSYCGVVTTLEDVVDDEDELISLREAVTLYANDGETIIFAEQLAGGTITLSLGEITIDKCLAIDASSVTRITIDANGASRIFNVVGGSADCPVVLTNLTLTGASSEGDGGAINNSGILTINNSLIKGNSAAYGAGIYNTGTLSISNSEISGNAASGLGGGINNHFATLTMTNCTISGNSSSVYGGGIVNHFSSLTISNSIITFNKASYDVDIYNIVNAKLGYNLDKGIFSTSNIIGFDPCFVVAPVFESGRIANLDELDLSLKSESWAIDRGSNAFVNAESDVTGNLRISGAWKTEAVVDIGAYEYQGRIEKEAETPSTVVTTAGDAIDDTDHLISLREAVLYSSAGDTITFAQSLEDQAITLLNKQIVIDKAVSIDASGVNSITVNANGLSSVFDIIAGTEENPVKLSNLVITGGSVQYVGGGINNSGNLYIVNSKIKGNHAGFGAGIYNEGTFRAVNVEICGNTASNYGGGVFNNYDATLVNATVTGNFSSRTGGGIYNQETMSVYNSIVVLNTANAGSPDIYHLEREVLNGYNTLTSFSRWTDSSNCILYDSYLPLFADTEGGDYSLIDNSQALNVGDNTYVTTQNDLARNRRIMFGIVDIGAYEFQRESYACVVTTLDDIVDNTDNLISLREAVAIYAKQGETITFADELAGGTISLAGTEIVIDKGMTIDASSVAGITIDANGTSRIFKVTDNGGYSVNLIGLILTGGNAVEGGAVLNSGTLALTNTLITGNKANLGGAISNGKDGTVSFYNVTIAGNSAASSGGVYNTGIAYFYNTIAVLNSGSLESKGDIVNADGVVYADSTLSTFNNWTSSSNCYEYNPSSQLFMDPENGDYTLADESVAINAGNNSFVRNLTDLNGYQRISHNNVDLGAYESAKMLAFFTGEGHNFVSYGANRQQLVWGRILNILCYEMIYSQNGGESWFKVEAKEPNVIITDLNYGAKVIYRIRALRTDGLTYTEWSDPKSFNVCPMDINGDGDINGLDRNLMSNSWGISEGVRGYHCYVDINGDGDITGLDRSYLGINWGYDVDDENLLFPRLPAPRSAADVVFAAYASGDIDIDLNIF